MAVFDPVRAIPVPPLRGWSASHWRGKSVDSVSHERRREAPAVNSRARERVVGQDRQNRGLKGRHLGAAQIIHRLSVMGGSKSDIAAATVWVRAAGTGIARLAEARPLPSRELLPITDAIQAASPLCAGKGASRHLLCLTKVLPHPFLAPTAEREC